MAPKHDATAPVPANLSAVLARLATPLLAFVVVPCGVAGGPVAAVIERSVGATARAAA